LKRRGCTKHLEDSVGRGAEKKKKKESLEERAINAKCSVVNGFKGVERKAAGRLEGERDGWMAKMIQGGGHKKVTAVVSRGAWVDGRNCGGVKKDTKRSGKKNSLDGVRKCGNWGERGGSLQVRKKN